MNGYQLIVALAASCGGLLYGYEIGVMNVVLVMDAFRMFFEETGKKPFMEGFITSSFLFGAVFGAVLSSYLSNKTSSQKILMFSGLIFTFGSLIQGSTVFTFIMLSFGRFISGIAIGCVSVLCPTYIAEVASASIRNAVITCYQLMIAVGILMASVINGLIWYGTNEWRLALWLQIIPGLLFTLFMYFLPCSPRYLCSQNKDKEAINVLAKLNGTHVTDLLVQEEYKATIISVTNMEALGDSTYKELFNRRNRRRTFITFFMQFFQQCTGINAVLYYQTQLFHGVGFSKVMSAIILPALNNIVYFISSFLGMINVQRIGRKHLLVIGGTLLLLLNIAITKGNFRRFLFAGSVFLFTLVYGCTWGPVPKVYQAEVFPLRMRVKGTTFSTVSHFISSWLVVFITPILIDTWGMHAFILFSVCCYIALMFAVFCCIEPRGLSMEEIDEEMVLITKS
ncbi:hypothetical protein PIROE2DRAFT_47016 [Piromyces sp. E2]|nr:hypothetical protein PIROE2DRAFT_47016 [Piromyces sp. E2]|eukprot:OUM59503.1 hypothetical protein PIROE2DRAFT_47016 [Piromyces sp. E2]